MKLYVKVKAIAKKKPMIEAVPIEVPEAITNSNDLVAFIVRQNVRDFNQQAAGQEIFRYLTDEEMANRITTGKIGFGEKHNETEQNEEKAVENALQCYEDGIFRMLIQEETIEYNQPVKLKEGDELVFIRLTMLAGRLW